MTKVGTRIRDEWIEDKEILNYFLTDLNKGYQSKLTVLHFLGVDGMGHETCNPTDPRMEDPILNYDAIIRKLLDSIDDKTTLILTGDHGMNKRGFHGGLA